MFIYPLFLFYQVHSSVIGIDFGSELIKSSIIHPGKCLTILENSQSKRSTPSAISFGISSREYGFNALKEQIKRPEDTILFIHNLFTPSSYFSRTFQSMNFSENTERNSSIIKIKENFYEIEEIAGMILEHIKEMSEKFVDGEIVDSVITVPSFWTRGQRVALINSALIGGFNVLSLVNENTAAALYYGLDRFDNVSAHFVMFYNLGASYLQVSLAKYSTVFSKSLKKNVEHIEILAHVSDQYLGGSLFDSQIAQLLVSKFQEKHSVSLFEHPKAMARVLAAANSAKKTLSANKSTQIILNSLFNGTDFSYTLTREELEGLLFPFTDRLTDPVLKILSKTGLSPNNVSGLEIVGGISRIPKIQEMIKEKTGFEIFTHLNGDESMAHGAAFYAGNFSAGIKVKNLWLSDISSHEYYARFVSEEDLEWNKGVVLFKEGDLLGSSKKLMVEFSKDVQVVVAENVEGKIKPVCVYVVGGISELAREDVQLFFHFVLDRSGFPYLYSANAVYDRVLNQTKAEEEKKETFEKSSQSEESEKNSSTHSTNTTANPNNTTDDSKNTTTDSNNTFNSSTPKTILLKFQQIELESPKMLSSTQVSEIITKLTDQKEKEKLSHLLTEHKNELESFLYHVSDKLQDPNFAVFSTLEEQAEINSALTNLTEWIMTQEFQQASLVQIQEKKNILVPLVQNVLLREEEHLKRPQALESFWKTLEKLKNELQKINETKPEIPESDLKAAWILVNTTSAWVKVKEAAQSQLPFSRTPSFLTQDLQSKLNSIQILVDSLKSPKKSKKTSKPTKHSESGTAAAKPTDL